MNKLTTFDVHKLFANLAFGIIVMQLATIFLPGISLGYAAIATVVGTLIGSYMLAKISEVSARHDLTTGEIFTSVFGNTIGAKLLIAINVFTFVGWTAVEIMVAKDLIIASVPINPILLMVILALVISALVITTSIVVVKKFIGKFISPLLFASAIAITTYCGYSLYNMPAEALTKTLGNVTGEMPFSLMLDILIAIPISWALCIAELTKNSHSPKAAFNGTLWGYTFANILTFAIGISFSIVSPGATAMSIVTTMFLGNVIAFIIAIAELDNAYSNAYSSIEQLKIAFNDKLSFNVIGVAVMLIALTIAIFADYTALEGFLLLIGALITPAIAIMITHFKLLPSDSQSKIPAFIFWVFGVVVYQGIVLWAPTFGATLPSLLVSGVSYYIYLKLKSK